MKKLTADVNRFPAVFVARNNAMIMDFIFFGACL